MSISTSERSSRFADWPLALKSIHETLLHSRWMYTFDRMEAFLEKFFGEWPPAQPSR